MATATHKPRRAGQPPRKQPITRHPLFPVVVALWFAALVGLGSFAIRTSVIEQWVLAANLDSVLPAAAPPLGAKARLALALALGLVGGAIGWLLAWRMAHAKPRPAPKVFAVADLEEAAPPHAALPQAEPAPVLNPAGLAAEIEEPEEEPEIVAPAEPEPPKPLTAAQRIASADLAELSHVELIERLAIALQRREKLRDVEEAAAPASVVRFPDRADRRSDPVPLRVVPQETERALRDALVQLKRLSGTR